MEIKHLRTKEIIIILVVLVVIKLGISAFYDTDKFSFDQLKYSFYTSTMDKMDTKGLENLLAQDEERDGGDNITIIYMGRDSCPYCVKLISRINQIFNNSKSIKLGENSVKINRYYFDSEKNDNKKTRELRESIGVEFVPTIIVIKNGNVSLFKTERLEEKDYLAEFSKVLES